MSQDNPLLQNFSLKYKLPAFYFLYVAFASLGGYFSFHDNPFVSFWLPAGLYIGVLLASKKEDWKFFLFTAIAANITFDLLDSKPFFVAVLFAITNSIEAFLGSYLIRRLKNDQFLLSNIKDITYFAIFSIFISPFIGATLGAGIVTYFFHPNPYYITWLVWFSGDSIGALAVAPIIIAWSRGTMGHMKFPDTKRINEIIITFVVFIIIIYLIFWKHGILLLYSAYFIFPVLLLVGIRYSLRTLSIFNFILVSVSIWATAHGHGEFSQSNINQAQHAFSTQLFLMIALFTSMVVNAVIEERKKTEKELKDSEYKFRNIFESSGIGMALCDSDGKFIRINTELAFLLGFDEMEIIGKSYKEFSYPEDMQKESVMLQSLINGKSKNYQLQKRFITKNSDIFWALVSASSRYDSAKSLKELIFQIQDINEQKRAESERYRLQNLESLGILAGGIAHDFNNILATIVANADLVMDEVKDTEVFKSIKSIQKSAQRATGLTKQLLTFAKGGSPEKKSISLRQSIQEITNFSLSGSNISVSFNFNESFFVDADEGQISQVIQNLVINAIQAMALGGKITISLDDFIDTDSKKYVKITVEDEGSGIEGELLEKIFDPYFTTKEKGTGLGLSVCYSIIKKHEGKISVDSKLGKGTKFIILLPAVEKKNEQKEIPSFTNQASLKILAMDDEEDIRDLMELLLKKIGHTVILAKEGLEAINKYKNALDDSNPFDLVVLDLTIKGGLGGKEAAIEIIKIDPQARIIISSGYADESLSGEIKNIYKAKLAKPFTKNDLKNSISTALNT